MNKQVNEQLIASSLINEQQLKLIENQIEQKQAEAIVTLALLYKEIQAYEAMTDLLLKAIGLNDANAFYELGNLYFEGIGVKESELKAFQQYEKAATLGHPDAMNNLADMYMNGEGTSINMKLAKHWFEKAAAAGVSEAKFTLGIFYEQGLAGEIDEDLAFEYYVQAANEGYEEAQYYVGTIYLDGLLNIEEDAQVALKWFELAAKKFHLDAIFNLAYCYENGLGVALNEQKAIRYYKQAALMNDPSAMERLAILYETVGSKEAQKWWDALERLEQ